MPYLARTTCPIHVNELARVLNRLPAGGLNMRRREVALFAAAVFVVGALLVPAPVVAQTGSQMLATIHLNRDVIANGQRLPAGTYIVRQVSLPVRVVPGQTPGEYRWVEFIQNGDVKGREVAVVLATPRALPIAETPMPPMGRARVDLLRGEEYVRVWVNQGGTHFLVHLATAGAPIQ